MTSSIITPGDPVHSECTIKSHLESWIEYHPRRIDLSLGRVRRLLADLGHPERNLPSTIHIAGTNGKGSLSAFLRSMFEAAGLKCHTFLSPHICRFNERISLEGQDIDDQTLLSLIQEVEYVNKQQAITYFEMTTAVAFLAYARHPADALVLETGLGGEFDATNVIPNPVINAFTPIDFDHRHILGPRLAQIAQTKAGIMKHGAAVISAPQRPTVARILLAHARQFRTHVSLGGRDWFVTRKACSTELQYDRKGHPVVIPKPGLAGEFQYENAALAYRTAQIFSHPKLTSSAMVQGIKNASIPGRLQRLTTTAWPQRWELWCDGGHNPHAARALAVWLSKRQNQHKWLVFGALVTKSWHESLAYFSETCSHISALSVKPGDDATARNSVPTHEIEKTATRLGFSSRSYPSLHAWHHDCVKNIRNLGPDTSGTVLIFGSLYLAGRILNSTQPRFSSYAPDYIT